MCLLQHIGLPMFSPDKKPRRIHMMTLGVLNLPRQPVLDWAFGHSLISCHVEHHLFPWLSDHMCLKVENGWAAGVGRAHLRVGGGNLRVHLNPQSHQWPLQKSPRKGRSTSDNMGFRSE